MDNKAKECTPYSGEQVSLSLPWRKRGFYVRVRTLVVIAALVCVIVLVVKGGWKDGFLNGIFKEPGAESDEMISTEGEPGADSFVEEDNSEESETGAGGSESESEIEADTESGAEDSLLPEEGEVVSVDLSLAEKGDAYVINYSDRNLDFKGILEMGFMGGKYAYSEYPLVLILHTFTSESYYGADLSQPLDAITKSVVTVGERVVYELNRQGVPTVHCTVIHDGDSSKNPYASAEETIKTMLDIYPSIEYVIDLRRMAETDGEGRVLGTESAIGSAQIRLSVSSEGILMRDTLALALSLRRELNAGGRRICMPVVFTDSEYNAPLSPYYLKIDIGSSGNEIEEALSAGDLLATELAALLKK